MLFGGTVQEPFTQGWCSAMGVGQPVLVLEISGPLGQWEGANGLSPGGIWTPWDCIQDGQEAWISSQSPGAKLEGKKVEKKLWSAADRHTSAFPMPWGARQAGFSLASPPSHQPAQDTLKALVWAWSVDTAPGTGVQWKMNDRGSDKGQGHSHLTEKSVFTDYSSVFPGVTCGNRPG